MFGFVKKNFVRLLTFVRSLARVANVSDLIKFVYLNNPPCLARLALVALNSKTIINQFIIQFLLMLTSVVNSKSYNTIDAPYSRICVLDKVKNINAKVFNLMSRVNETGFVVHHEPYYCKGRLNENIYNSKQKLSHNKSVDWS